MTFPLRSIFVVIAWSAGALAALQLGRVTLPPQYEHFICGPWGCGPRVMDLLAYHLFLICLVTLLCYIASQAFPRAVVRRLGGGLLLLGAAALLGLLVHEIQTGWDIHRDHFLQRYLFRVAASVDIPAVASLVGGCLLCWWSSRRTTIGQPEPTDPSLVDDQAQGT